MGGVVDGREEDKTMQKETARRQEWVVRKGRRSVFPGGVGGLRWDLSAKPAVSHSQRRPPIFPPPPVFGGTVGEPSPGALAVQSRFEECDSRAGCGPAAAALRIAETVGRAQTHQSSSSSPTREGRWMVWTLRRPIRLFTRACFPSHSPTVPPELGLCRFAALNQLLSHNWLLEGTACFKT